MHAFQLAQHKISISSTMAQHELSMTVLFTKQIKLNSKALLFLKNGRQAYIISSIYMSMDVKIPLTPWPPPYIWGEYSLSKDIDMNTI